MGEVKLAALRLETCKLRNSCHTAGRGGMTRRKARGSERRAGAEREPEDVMTATGGEEEGKGAEDFTAGCLGRWEFLYRNKGVGKKRWIHTPQHLWRMLAAH